MRAINHALTGALIGLTVSEPAIALPAAVGSHFVCDAIPHFGVHSWQDIRARWFRWLLPLDMALCVALVGVLAISRPGHWQIAAVSAFLATSPDLLSVSRLWRYYRGGDPRPNLKNPLIKFHQKIQWYERPPGVFVEIAWLLAGLILLAPFIDAKP